MYAHRVQTQDRQIIDGKETVYVVPSLHDRRSLAGSHQKLFSRFDWEGFLSGHSYQRHRYSFHPSQYPAGDNLKPEIVGGGAGLPNSGNHFSMGRHWVIIRTSDFASAIVPGSIPNTNL